MSLFGPLVAYPPTPRTRDGAVSTDALESLVDRAVRAGASGVAVLGSTGGFAYLDRPERRRVVAAAVHAADGRVPVMAGVGAITTRDVLAHVADAREAGAAAVLVPTTAYLPLSDEEAVGLLRDVAAVAGVPVWAYHNPVTGFSYSVETLRRVAALPGVAGVKDRGSDAEDLRDRVTALRAALPAHVELGCSGDVLGLEGLLAGARTWHSGLAGVLPGWFAAVAAAAADGREGDARQLMDRLEPVVRLVMVSGGPRAVHAVATLTGVDAGHLPAPLLPPSSSAVDAMADALARLGEPPVVPRPSA